MESNHNSNSRKWVLFALIIWTLIHFYFLIYGLKKTTYSVFINGNDRRGIPDQYVEKKLNQIDTFFPLQSAELKFYDFSEFFVYAVSFWVIYLAWIRIFKTKNTSEKN